LMTVGEDDPITRLSFARFNISPPYLSRMREGRKGGRSGQTAGLAVDARPRAATTRRRGLLRTQATGV